MSGAVCGREMSFMGLPLAVLEQCWLLEMSCKGKWNTLKKLGEKLKALVKEWEAFGQSTHRQNTYHCKGLSS